MIKIKSEVLKGTFLLEVDVFSDERGLFVKTYHAGNFENLGISLAMEEEFFSVSGRGVIRGMHFQLPPEEHSKLVYCVKGAVLDVLLDLRRSGDYGKVATVELGAKNRDMLFIPPGVAHGFLSLENDTILLYKTSSVHNPALDAGIRWNSFGFSWPEEHPVISARDRMHIDFQAFDSPFL